jgi:hypothetical protein
MCRNRDGQLVPEPEPVPGYVWVCREGYPGYPWERVRLPNVPAAPAEPAVGTSNAAIAQGWAAGNVTAWQAVKKAAAASALGVVGLAITNPDKMWLGYERFKTLLSGEELMTIDRLRRQEGGPMKLAYDLQSFFGYTGSVDNWREWARKRVIERNAERDRFVWDAFKRGVTWPFRTVSNSFNTMMHAFIDAVGEEAAAAILIAIFVLSLTPRGRRFWGDLRRRIFRR